MLEKDPEFYRKWIAITEYSSINPLKATIDETGNTITIRHHQQVMGQINTALFHRMTVFEIMSKMGIPRKDRII